MGDEAHATSASPALVTATFELAMSARRPGRTCVLGIQGPQGSGKSTTAAGVVRRARDAGLSAVAVSIDDFYLTRAEQLDLARRHVGNRYLEHRGYPGTHDVALGARTQGALRAARGGETVSIPVYDKGAHAGRGDRAPRDRWVDVVGPIDLVVFEGWMLGFSPAASEPEDAALRVAASFLPAYAAWTACLDALVVLEVDALDVIVAWRIDAERARRAAGSPGLTDDEARDYIERFLPAYRLWAGGVRAPRGVPTIRVRLGADRNPLEIGSPKG